MTWQNQQYESVPSEDSDQPGLTFFNTKLMMYKKFINEIDKRQEGMPEILHSFMSTEKSCNGKLKNKISKKNPDYPKADPVFYSSNVLLSSVWTHTEQVT